MVQYRESSRGYSRSFWKLEAGAHKTIAEIKSLLAAKGYHCPANVNRTSIKDLFGRFQRGLLAYRRYNVTMLRGFCKSRNLPEASFSLQSRAALVQALENADDNATFDGLLNLPAELRDTIYAFYFRSLKVPYYQPQPPLTTASRQLRSESLPGFYKNCTFPISLLVCIDAQARQRFGDGPFYASGLHLDTTAMVTGITDKNFAMIRHFSTTLRLLTAHGWAEYNVHFDLSPLLSPEVAVKVRRCRSWIHSRNAKYYQEFIKGALISLLNDMKPWQGGFVTKNTFLGDCKKVVHEALRSVPAFQESAM